MIKWQELSTRERYLLISGSIFLFFCILYFGIFAPLLKELDVRSQELTEKRSTLQWMMQLPRAQPTTTSSHNPVQLLTLISKQLSKVSFNQVPYQLQQIGASDLQ